MEMRSSVFLCALANTGLETLVCRRLRVIRVSRRGWAAPNAAGGLRFVESRAATVRYFRKHTDHGCGRTSTEAQRRKRSFALNSRKRSAAGDEAAESGPSRSTQTALTLFVVIHFFCIAVVMSSNYSPSPVQQRLTRLFAVYTQSLNFDLNYTPFHLTHATDQDVDHALQYSTAPGADEEQWRDVARGWRVGERRKRYQRLAGVLSFFREDNVVSSRIGQAVASGLANHDEVAVTKVRCRKHFLLPWDRYGESDRGDPDASEYFQTVYGANVLVSSGGVVDVVKIEAPKDVARPRLEGSDNQ